MTQPPPDTPPPAVKSSPIKPLTLIACGVLLAALLLAVVMSIEAPAPTGTKPGDLEAFEVDELIAPSNLSEEDLDVGDSSMGRGIDLEVGRGGSIDIVNKNGELAQRYRYRNLDPSPDDLPDNWYRMEQPVAQFFLPNNRVLILSGESAQAYAPNRVIESGTITGDVLIRLFETPDGRPVNVQKDAPSLVVRMEEAQFNNLLGEVRCDGWVRIESRAVELLGQKLTALIDDQHGHLRLWIDRVDYIRLAASGRSPGSPTVADSQPSPAAPIGASDEPPEPMAGAPGEPAETEAQFYRLTIDGNVRVRQGTGGHARIATGDTLFLVFSPQSESLGDMLAGRPRRGSRRAGVDTESPPHLFGRGSQSRA